MKERSIKVHKILGIIFIIVGIVFYFTPMPGTTFLIILGFIWYKGKKKTTAFLKEVFSKKMYESLKIKNIMKEI